MKNWRKIKRKISFVFKILSFLTVFLLLISLVVYFLTGDFFKITYLNCTKENHPCTDKEKSFFLDLIGENIFLLDSNKIVKALKKTFPKIDKLKIKKQLPNKVLIELTERKSLAGIAFDKKNCYLVDQYGYVLEKTKTCPKTKPKIVLKNIKTNFKLNEEIKEPGLKAGLLVVKLMKDNFLLLNGLVVDSDQRLTLDLSENVTATLSVQKDISLQVDSLQFILRQSKIEGDLPSYIDLRFDKPVIR